MLKFFQWETDTLLAVVKWLSKTLTDISYRENARAAALDDEINRLETEKKAALAEAVRANTIANKIELFLN